MTAPPRGAFVRRIGKLGFDFDAWYPTVAQAEDMAQMYAALFKGVNYYTGHVGCDPREESRWQWDTETKTVIRYCCND